MRSSVYDILPYAVRRSLTQFGSGICIARKKRRITVEMMAERLGVSKGTYLRVEKGNPRVALGVYAMALFALGLGSPFNHLVDPTCDEQGMLLDEEHLPKRVRVKKEPSLK